MKAIIWTAGGLLALSWTGAMALLALMVGWVGTALQQAGAAGATAAAQPPAMPAWLAGWVDPAAWTAAAQWARGALEASQSVLPYFGTAASWLEPLVWLLWGAGLAALLALAAGAHWMAARRAAA